ncbi:hypothetical protein H6P81_015418 [Aristolochia fimbriata]|uniref:N-acetylglucosaminylphosphatidylinositol deacetylase n=1 Tax=Aristolochia fimbriata TaxID=158543 RepID=A0AAV7EA40_ARIFI|nr:hypothetical protein H6P81_015418 [Aristolochia fimbriata]
MDWLLFFILVALLWTFSLCVVLGVSRNQSSPFSVGRRNILLVVSHPDDESMFFSPTVLYLASRGHNVHVLCISIGNADGQGTLREEELYKACDVLKIPFRQVKVLNHPDLQDGFGNAWNHRLLAKIVGEEIESRSIDLVITFDSYGVSGHPNHRDVYHGICLLVPKCSRNIEAWKLISTSITRKYIGPVDIWFSLLWGLYYHQGHIYCILNGHPQRSFSAMARHASQWVWFRKLFVVFSSYTYINTLQKIN